MDESDSHKADQAVSRNFYEVLKSIDFHLVSIVGNVATQCKKAYGTYEASDFINDYLPALPYFLQVVTRLGISNITMKYNRLTQNEGYRVPQCLGYEQRNR